VSPASRRILLSGLLLLVPTLVVGGVAIQLLRREQARLATQGDYAQEARQAALRARARLVVENVELLVGDVQAALLDTLASEDEANLSDFLEQWRKSNPLVRMTFLCTPEGELIYPRTDATEEDARGFVRRFSPMLRENPPWAIRISEKQADSSETAARERAELARREISSNVAQVQSARRDVQELAKARDYSSSVRAAAAPMSSAAMEAEAAANSAQLADSSSGALPASSVRRAAKFSGESAAQNLPRSETNQEVAAAADLEAGSNAGSADQRGWTSIMKEGRLHLIGWVQPAGDGPVRGVELELAALISRLKGALPAETATDEGYALRDDQGRVVHQVGAILPSREPLVSVPLSQQSLAGWSVVAYLTPSFLGPVDGAGFFWTSTLLVALFIGAILLGGFLLLRQARRSELEALQKTSFVANVSHEFKTPLTTIRLYSELLEQGRVRDAGQGADYLRTIGRETERLARLVNNALDFSRLEQGQKKYAPERLDLAAELKRLLHTHAPRVAEAGLSLNDEIPTGPIHTTTDRDAVEQIVLNLVDNACKYAAAGGEVVVSAKAISTGGAEVCVCDRGPGVPADQQHKIFEKFHRVNDALTAEKTGAGLGLSIARQLARGLGGELFYAAREGGGAKFVLKLP
jgi:signal transduction histidine kinase